MRLAPRPAFGTLLPNERRKHGGELTESTFLFATVAKDFQAEGSREYLVRTLLKMSVQYDLLKEDDKTEPDEMRQILELAALVGILPDTTRFLDQLRNEFPKGLGKVSARYVIRYDSDAVSAAFQLPDGENRENLRELGRETMRRHIATRYTSLRSTDGMALKGADKLAADRTTATNYDRSSRFIHCLRSICPGLLSKDLDSL